MLHIESKYVMDNCLVLLASHNGELWLEEQLHSISSQEGVHIEVCISDDSSNDSSLEIISKYLESPKFTLLPLLSDGFGSAHKNFLRLIIDSDCKNFEFIAFSDQDDIWCSDKISKAINILRNSNSDGYSSDALAFWPDGSQSYIKKSYPQKKYDFLFESAGPGCTFVLTRHGFLQLKQWLLTNLHIINDFWVHDWLIYAFFRSHGLKWIIDSNARIRYRQHHKNEIGVNRGIFAFVRRVKGSSLIRYRRSIILLAKLFSSDVRLTIAISRLNLIDRFYLAYNVLNFRRSRKDSVFLLFLFLFAFWRQ